jgi:hypothetical protein
MKAQQKILAQKSSQIDARIALSFINMRVRQNDEKGMVHVKKYRGNDAIVLQSRGDYEYDTWIYFIDGKLLECVLDAGQEPGEFQGTEIANVLSFDVSFSGNKRSLVSKISFLNNEKAEVMEKIVTLSSV